MRVRPELVLICIWLAAMALVQDRDADDAVFTASEVAAAQDRKSLRPEDAIALSHPLDCDATVRVAVHYHDKTPGRCYVRKSQR